MQFIELPGLPQQITKKGEYLSIAKDHFGYKGKLVVVTGTTAGMGDAATKMLAEPGAEIYAIDIRELTEPVKKYIERSRERGLHPVRVDLSEND